jgi:hypothetical protein
MRLSHPIVKTWWQRIGVAVFLLGLAQMMWTSHVWYRYQDTLPRHADPATGNIYPLNVHGIVVYQTRDQRDRLDRFDHASFGIMFVAFALGFLYTRKFGFPPTQPKPWTPGPGWRPRSG